MSAAVVNSHRISIIWAPPSGPPARLQSDDPQDVARRLMDTVAAMTAVEFEEYWDSEPDDEVAKAKALASAVVQAAGLHPSKAHQTTSERPLAFPAVTHVSDARTRQAAVLWTPTPIATPGTWRHGDRRRRFLEKHYTWRF